MTLRVVGAGLPRTGTLSLKGALERLLGAPCYHMIEVFQHLDHAAVWRDALRGVYPDWEDTFLAGYAAAVDWPASRFWRQLSGAYPDAIVLLSQRDSAETWHRSMDKTVLVRARQTLEGDAGGPGGGTPPWLAGAPPEQRQAFGEMFELVGGEVLADPDDRDALLAAYDSHLAEVRAEVPADRLVEWLPGDGWEPLCASLGLPVPDEPFPHENTTAEFAARWISPWVEEARAGGSTADSAR